MSDRNTNRLKIKKTVEDAVPLSNIDVTKILTDEECAALHQQMEQRTQAAKMAAELGRAGLRARLKKTVMMVTDDLDEEEDKSKSE